MITHDEKWHYLAVKISVLLRGITSKHDDDFYCLNCFHSFRTKNKLEPYKTFYENKDFYGVIMPSEDTNILEFNQKRNVMTPSIIYADLEYLIKRIDG